MRLPRVILLTVAAAVAYVAWPIHTALQIREAMIAGDVATLTRKIEWESVRTSLKASIAPETIARLEADPDGPKPSLWQRVKSAVAPRLAGNVVDRYVTPQNLPVLLGYRRMWRGTLQPVLGREEPQTVLAGTMFADTAVDKFASFWKRLRRAVFTSPGTLILEVEDKYNAGRHYIGTMELIGLEWKLTALTLSGPGL
jgi:Protein of unknown function (DUF2939)